jgi:transcriptional regulator with XRE-family HTH domain
VAGDEKELGAEVFKVLGPRMAEKREKLGLSQEELADLAGLHGTAISPLELGKRGTYLVNALRIAAALRMTPALFLDGVFWDLDDEAFTDTRPVDLDG